MITEVQFLKLIHFPNKIPTFEQFKKKATIKRDNGTKRSMSNEKSVTTAHMRALWMFFFKNGKDTLTNHYKLNLLPKEFDEGKKTDYVKKRAIYASSNRPQKNRIKNLFFKELYFQTTTGLKNAPPNYYIVLRDIYRSFAFNYRLVTPYAVDIFRKQKGIMSMLSGVYFRASVYSPVFFYWVYNVLIGNKRNVKVLAPTLSWCSSLLASTQNDRISEFVGIDVIPRVCSEARKLLAKSNLSGEIWCAPSESLNGNPKFKKKYMNRFDVALFSPPFFRLELYKGGKQSTSLYKTSDEWLEKYWEKTCAMCKYTLKQNGIFAYTIINYDDEAALVKDMNRIAKKYFKYKGNYVIHTTQVTYSKHGSDKQANEILFVFN